MTVLNNAGAVILFVETCLCDYLAVKLSKGRIEMHRIMALNHQPLIVMLCCVFISTTMVFNSIGNLSILANLFFLPLLFSMIVKIITGQRIIFNLELLLLGLFVVTSIITLLATGRIENLKICYSIVSMWLLVLSLYNLISVNNVSCIIWCILVSVSALVIICFAFYEGGQLGENVTNTVNLGINVSLCSIFISYKLTKRPSVKCLLILFVSIMIILLTQNRSSLVISIMVLFLCVFFNQNNQKIRKKILLIFLALIAIYIGIESGFFNQYTQRFHVIEDQIQNIDSGRGSVSIRLNLKKIGFEAFLDDPIFGHGIGTSRQFLEGTYFHDNYIQLLYETGIVGTSLYLASLVVVMIKAIKRKRFLPLLLICFILMYGVFDVTYHNKVFYIVMSLAIILLQVPKNGMRDSDIDNV